MSTPHPAPALTLDNLKCYTTARLWATFRGLSPVRGVQLLAGRRFSDMICLPDGTVLVHREAKVMPPHAGPQPARNVPFPEGTTSSVLWARRHRLGSSDARTALKLEPGRVLAQIGPLTLVRDLPPPKPLFIPPRELPQPSQLSPGQLAQLPGLPESWRCVLEWRREGQTFAQIGSALGITRQRAEQLQRKALLRLTAP